MVIPYLSQGELLLLLKRHGWNEVSNKDWDTHNRIMVGNGKDSFPLQLKSKYGFNHVVRLCESLGIEPPEDHKLCYEQYKALRERGDNGPQ